MSDAATWTMTASAMLAPFDGRIAQLDNETAGRGATV